MLKYNKRVICEGRTFLVFHDSKGYWAAEDKDITNGVYQGKRNFLRDDLNEVIEAIIQHVNIEKLMKDEGLSRFEAAERVLFG